MFTFWENLRDALLFTAFTVACFTPFAGLLYLGYFHVAS